jgi:hypothetical protein
MWLNNMLYNPTSGKFHNMLTYAQGYFVMEHAVTPFHKFFLRSMQAGAAFQNLFYLASIYLTPPLNDRILGHYAFWNLFPLEK